MTKATHFPPAGASQDGSSPLSRSPGPLCLPLHNLHQLFRFPSLLQTYTPAPQRSMQKGGKLLGQHCRRIRDEKLDGTRTGRGQSSPPPRLGPTLEMGIQARAGWKRHPPPQSTPPASSTTTERHPLGFPMKLERDGGGESQERTPGKGSGEEKSPHPAALGPQFPLPALGERSHWTRHSCSPAWHLPSVTLILLPRKPEAHSHGRCSHSLR